MKARRRAWRGVEEVLRDACGTQFTAAVARIEQGGRARFERAYGATRADEHARPVYVDTRFDLASLTKIFVASLLLQAVQTRAVSLDAPLVQWLPEWVQTPHAPITARRLLAHDSGMNSGADYRELLGRDIVGYALRRELVCEPGACVIYSDLGFIAIGELLRRLSGQGLVSQIRSFGNPGSMVGFRPRERSAIPATEADEWRGRVQGFVHDEKAFLMGGIAGHAGLFGSAADVAWITEQYLAAIHGRTLVFA